MAKGYHLIFAQGLDRLPGASEYDEFHVVILHWLIEKLYLELEDDLADVELDIVECIHHCSVGGYPVIGAHHQRPLKEAEALNTLLEATVNRLLQQSSISELINFYTDTALDWKAITDDILKQKSAHR